MDTRPDGVPDDPFPQKRAEKHVLPGGRHPNDVRRLARTGDGSIWVATADGLFIWRKRWFERLPEHWTGGSDVRDLAVDANARLIVATLLTVAVYDPGLNDWSICLPDAWDTGVGGILSAASVSGRLFAASSERGFGEILDGSFTPLAEAYPDRGRVIRLQAVGDSLWVLGDRGAVCLSVSADDLQQECHVLEDTPVRAVGQRSDAVLCLATPKGLFARADAGAELVPTPTADIHDIAMTDAGDTWVATSSGVARLTEAPLTEARTHYYGGPRWLPHDDVRSLLHLDDTTTLVATASGCSVLTHKPLTLHQKASEFDTAVRARHQRLKGFVTASRLSSPGNLASSIPAPSDNDGLWTALYLAAQSYRFAVTGEEEARVFAAQAFDAMAWLESVTTVDGYPTKAILPAGDDTGSDTVPWYPSADGKWLWKGDCSSDEIDGHLYGYAVYYDLAADEEEKTRIRALVSRILDHIIDNGYFIVGPEGEHTRWGVWSPDHLNGPWRAQQGLNSLEILAHLRTAHHITGESRYESAYRELVDRHHYHENVRRQKLTLPGHVNHSDDELAFISYYPLLRYEHDVRLRDVYLDSLRHAWDVERPERNPLWNFIYGALTGDPCDIDLSVRTLRELPLDQVDWPMRNSHRSDVTVDAVRGRFGELQSVGVLPYDELSVLRWNANPYRLDGQGRGLKEEDGAHFLLPYWMGRYYSFIT